MSTFAVYKHGFSPLCNFLLFLLQLETLFPGGLENHMHDAVGKEFH